MRATRAATTFLLLAGLLGCAEAPRRALIGTWRSDRAATLLNVDACKCVSPEQRAWLEQNLGQMTVEYTESTMTARLPGWTDAGPYAVVAEGEDWVELRRTDLDEKEARVHRVRVDGDRMRVKAAHLGFEEVLARVE